MNTAIFWRLVWKEYRQQQSLWIAIAFAGLIFQVATLVYCTLNGLPDLPDRLFAVALSVPILYSLGCGAALFAGEHEAGTFPFQQALPATAARVFAAKLAFAAASAFVLFPVFWLVAFALASWRLPDAVWHGQLWAGGVVATFEILIWSVLGSLVLRRVLPAAVTGGVTAVVLGYGSLVAVVAFGGLFEQQANEYFSTLPMRSIFALLALCISIQLGRRWFDERPSLWSPAVPRRTSVVRRERVKPATTSSMLVRLLWHEVRQARPTMLWCVGGYLIVLASTGFESTAFLPVLVIVATIFGASVFAGDQRQENYLFFTEHGVRPRLVWFSRHVVWAVPLGVLVAMAWWVQWLTSALEPHQFGDARIATGLVVLMFAVGQLCSILIRSNIVAVFTSAMCGLLLFFWSAFTVGIGVPWWLSAFPLPLILVAASWLYAPKWIQQRYTWRVRFFTAATIVVPLACVVAAVAAYRVHEIPAIQTSFATTPVPNVDSPEARETAAMYAQADQLLRSKLNFDPEGAAAVASSNDDDWRKGIILFKTASERKSCRFHRWDDAESGAPFDGSQLTTAVLAEAKMLLEKGDSDTAGSMYLGLLKLARDYYQQDDPLSSYMAYGLAVESKLFADLPAWAASDATSYDATIEFLNQLRQWCGENEIDWRRAKATQLAVLQRVIAMDDIALRRYYGASGTELAAIKGLGMLTPWERVRMSRLAEVAAEAELQGIEQIRERGPRIPPYQQADLPWDVTLTSPDGQQRTLMRSTDVTGWVMYTRWLAIAWDRGAPGSVFVEQKMQLERKAVQTQLALIAWQKQHGQLPDSLHDLLSDPFESLPLDPYTKQPFVYLPNGVVEEIWDDPYGGMGSIMEMGGMSEAVEPDVEWHPPKRRLVRSAPFLWSPAAMLRYAPSASRSPSASPVSSDFRDQSGQTISDVNLLYEGVRYLLPKTETAEESLQPSDSSDDADALPSDE